MLGEAKEKSSKTVTGFRELNMFDRRIFYLSMFINANRYSGCICGHNSYHITKELLFVVQELTVSQCSMPSILHRDLSSFGVLVVPPQHASLIPLSSCAPCACALLVLLLPSAGKLELPNLERSSLVMMT